MWADCRDSQLFDLEGANLICNACSMSEEKEALYDLTPVVAPVLRGWVLMVFNWLLHGPLGSLLLALLRSKAGIQRLRTAQVEGLACFAPIWPDQGGGQADSGPTLRSLTLAGLSCQARAATAAAAVLETGPSRNVP